MRQGNSPQANARIGQKPAAVQQGIVEHGKRLAHGMKRNSFAFKTARQNATMPSAFTNESASLASSASGNRLKANPHALRISGSGSAPASRWQRRASFSDCR